MIKTKVAGFFGGSAFFQPIRAIQKALIGRKKRRPSKRSSFVLIMQTSYIWIY